MATIEPPALDFPLAEGSQTQRQVTVTIPKRTPETRFDVYLLADSTASIRGILSVVQSRAGDILTVLRGTGLDVAIGVGNYKDFAGDEVTFQHQLAVTTDAAAGRIALEGWAARAGGGGGDEPEAQLFALHR